MPPEQTPSSWIPPITFDCPGPSLGDYEEYTVSTLIPLMLHLSYASHEFDGEPEESHFSRLLRKKWECQQEGHSVCVPTEDGEHFQLSDHNIEEWVNALVSKPCILPYSG